MKELEMVEGPAGDREQTEMVSLCSLSAGGTLFGIDTRKIREVLGPRKLERVPLAAAYIGGVLPYRGEVLTAVSLRALLGMAANEGRSCVLVLDGEEGEERFGLMVDSVGGVVVLERRTLAENPSTLDEVSKALYSGAYRMSEGLLIELDPGRLNPSRLGDTGLFGHAAGGNGAGHVAGFRGHGFGRAGVAPASGQIHEWGGQR